MGDDWLFKETRRMTSGDSGSNETRLTQAYERMIERTRTVLEHAKTDTLPHIRQMISTAQEKAVEVGELTREESERIGKYLHRDLHDAAEYLSYTGKSLGDWLNIDLDAAESKLLEMFSTVVDHTRLTLDELAAQARRAQELHTGEITGPGALRCKACGTELHFHAAGHVPPCPKCHATQFVRASRADTAHQGHSGDG